MPSVVADLRPQLRLRAFILRTRDQVTDQPTTAALPFVGLEGGPWLHDICGCQASEQTIASRLFLFGLGASQRKSLRERGIMLLLLLDQNGGGLGHRQKQRHMDTTASATATALGCYAPLSCVARTARRPSGWATSLLRSAFFLRCAFSPEMPDWRWLFEMLCHASAGQVVSWTITNAHLPLTCLTSASYLSLG